MCPADIFIGLIRFHRLITASIPTAPSLFADIDAESHAARRRSVGLSRRQGVRWHRATHADSDRIVIGCPRI